MSKYNEIYKIELINDISDECEISFINKENLRIYVQDHIYYPQVLLRQLNY